MTIRYGSDAGITKIAPISDSIYTIVAQAFASVRRCIFHAPWLRRGGNSQSSKWFLALNAMRTRVTIFGILLSVNLKASDIPGLLSFWGGGAIPGMVMKKALGSCLPPTPSRNHRRLPLASNQMFFPATTGLFHPWGELSGPCHLT
jgi:hypothetical protein